MHLMGTDYERLTIMVDVRVTRENQIFLIDYPQDFKETVAVLDPWTIRFDFKGEDKIPSFFKTSGGVISGRDIWIPFPRFIERKQRRRDFRISSPVGKRLEFLLDSKEHELSVINFSQGGALVSTGKGGRNELGIETGGRIKNLTLFIPFDKALKRIRVSEAKVRRVDQDSTTKHYRYGLQFTDIEREEKLFLKKIIYRTQRDLLRKR